MRGPGFRAFDFLDGDSEILAVPHQQRPPCQPRRPIHDTGSGPGAQGSRDDNAGDAQVGLMRVRQMCGGGITSSLGKGMMELSIAITAPPKDSRHSAMRRDTNQ